MSAYPVSDALRDMAEEFVVEREYQRCMHQVTVRAGLQGFYTRDIGSCSSS